MRGEIALHRVFPSKTLYVESFLKIGRLVLDAVSKVFLSLM